MSAARVTRRDVEETFSRFCRVHGLEESDGRFDRAAGAIPRGYGLDYASYYGGWKVVYYDGLGSYQMDPFGPARVGAREFCDRLRFAASVAVGLEYLEGRAASC